MKDTLIRALAADKTVRAFALNSTVMVNTACEILKCSAVSAAALGRTLTAASMMGAMLKSDKDTLTLQIKGGGPAGKIMAIADSSGNVRGYIDNPYVDTFLNDKGKLDVARAVGKEGFVTVTKDMGLKEPYIGQSEIISGEIAEDITNYFLTSEQTPSVCALGVLVDTDLSIKAAGGFIISVLPGCEDKIIDIIENNINNLKPVTTLLSEGFSILEILNAALSGLDVEILSETNIEYKCNCSKERTTKALISLGKKELEKIAKKQDNTELTCHFCNKKYIYTPEEIRLLLSEIKS